MRNSLSTFAVISILLISTLTFLSGCSLRKAGENLGWLDEQVHDAQELIDEMQELEEIK